MNKEQQDKFWEQLSEESKKYFIDQVTELQRLINAPSPSQAMRDEWRGVIIGYENVFGSHNLNPKPLTYEDVAKELFKGGAYSPACNTALFEFKRQPVEAFVLNCTTPKQANKLLAINKLLNVAKYLNGDWKPDWEDDTEPKWYICDIPGKKPIPCFTVQNNSCIVYFRTKELALQAIQILGEETIKLALSTNY